jgi:hypothetical protein
VRSGRAAFTVHVAATSAEPSRIEKPL